MSTDNITHLTINRLSDEQLITDILLEYSDDLDKAACDRCSDCTSIVMCRFHSVLSLLQRHSWPTAAIDRGVVS